MSTTELAVIDSTTTDLATVDSAEMAVIDAEPVRAWLGNVAARHAPPGNRVTDVVFPAQRTLAERFADITDPRDGLWRHHSDQAPAWVESNDDQLAALVAEHYGCPVGCPPSWAVSA